MLLALRQLVLGVSLVAMLASPSGMVPSGDGLGYGDVAVGSIYSESIAAVTTEGLMSGVGGNMFQPERDITAHELAFVLCKMNGLDVTWLSCVQRAVLEGYYDGTAASYGSRAIPYDVARVAIARANDVDVEFRDVRDESVGMSRGEAAHFVVRMRLWNELEERLVISAEPGYESVADEVRYKMMTMLPVEVLESLADNGWSVDVGGTYIKEYMVKNADKGYSSVIGLCSFGPKIIHVTTSTAIIHEVGHFWSRVMCQSKNDGVMFKADGTAGRALLGSYSTTNQLEFVAEAFRYYVEGRFDEDAMAAMRETMPTTYAEFVARDANGWVPESL